MPLNAHGSSSSQSSGESSRFCGVSLPFLPELSPLVLSSALSSGFDFVCLPLAHPLLPHAVLLKPTVVLRDLRVAKLARFLVHLAQLDVRGSP